MIWNIFPTSIFAVDGCTYSYSLIRARLNPSFTKIIKYEYSFSCCSLLSLVRVYSTTLLSISIEDVYDDVSAANARFDELNTLFKEKYGCMPEFYVRAPGRVNLIGEHIDYHKYCIILSILTILATLCSLWLLPMTWLWLSLPRRIRTELPSFLSTMW